jgi:hypothetical protein
MISSTHLDTIDRIGFTIPDKNGSGLSFEGLLRIGEDGLIMEYAPRITDDSGFEGSGEAFKKWANKHLGFEFETDQDKIKTIEIPFARLEFLKRRNYFVFSTLLLLSDSIRTFHSIPSQRQGRLTVYISWRHASEGARFVSNFNMQLADWRMKHADEMIEKVRNFNA